MAEETTLDSSTDSESIPANVDSSHKGGAGRIKVEDLSMEFDTKQGPVTVFSDISFTIESGQFVTLIGKSGSGKSTLLNIISGILQQSNGSVVIEDSEGNKAKVAHIFQSPRLLPWDTCTENIELVHENNPDFTEELAHDFLDMVGLSDQYDKYPTQLSGGQKQRVGIARGFSINPDVLMMDEPFSNLDEITAENLREELDRIWREFGKTVLFVTHDITEAVELADRILMLGDGRIYDDMTIDLERPRDVESEEFLRVRQDAINRFHDIN
ncbi:ABC transporter ATP-binding protein [Halobellus rufus]|uniref:ABC transporter ATP-binding protein n=1 Tax=Halobellus rufus TaxID=1448860 RepID=UPI0009DF9A65|nr:ABC transporter ATP-binding protein [Halobellus rufus]